MKQNKYLIMILFLLLLLNGKVFSYTLTPEEIHSQYAILMDYDTESILFEKNIDDKLYPASTTKILTALLVIENCNLDKIVTVDAETLAMLPPYSSNAALKVGEKLSIREILQCLMVVSGNDCALVLAKEVSGSVSSFVDLMNVKLKEIGCTNTHFTNPHGYHDDNHYTTARDMIKILKYGMKNSEFRKFLEIKNITIPATNTTPIRTYNNTNRMFFRESEIGRLAHYYEYNKGGKTGFTDIAHRTFVGYAQKDGRTLLIGVFKVKDVNHKDGKFLDAVNLYNYGFDQFETKTIVKKDTKILTIIDDNSKKDYYISKDINKLVSKDTYEFNKIQYTFDTHNNNTDIDIRQDPSTKVVNIRLNSTNLDDNDFLYYKKTELKKDHIKLLLNRVKINLYNLNFYLKKLGTLFA